MPARNGVQSVVLVLDHRSRPSDEANFSYGREALPAWHQALG